MRFMWMALFFLLGCASGQPALNRTPSGLVLDSSGYSYQAGDRSCDGYPRLNVGTAPGTCLGLVLPRDGQNLIMPRTLVQLKGSSDFLLIDMGGWKANNGALYLMKPNGTLTKLLSGLNMPHGLSYGLDDWIYVGESTQIIRFHFKAGQITDRQLVHDKLARSKGYMHPLTQFTFDPNNGDMYVNYGSPTDHCFDKAGGYQTCPEGQLGHGAILRLPERFLTNLPKGGVAASETTAIGLRNSMAMVVAPTGFLVQGENARDFPELEEPYEEVNVIHPVGEGRHYGWPFCYDFHATSPEWAYRENKVSPLAQSQTPTVNCANLHAKNYGEYQPPWVLLPPHSAPLHMAYYNGPMFKDWTGRLLVSLHGYQPSGHRLIAFRTDRDALPAIHAAGASPTYSFDQKGSCAIQRPYAPRGGLDRAGVYEELIHTWDQKKGVRPKGAPVGFTVAEDGSIYIVEDRENRTVVRLSRTTAGPIESHCDRPDPNFTDPRIELLAWRRAALRNPAIPAGLFAAGKGLVQKHCAQCHGGFKETDIAGDRFMLLDFLIKNEWIVPGKSGHSKIVQAIAQTGEFPGMPPTGNPQIIGDPESEQAFAALKTWIDGLPQDVNSTFQKIVIASGRRIRSANGNAGKECGRFEPGDTVYVNPSGRVKKDGWLWSEVYVVPQDSRLFFKACSYPEEGVFWMALTKAP